MPGLLRGVARTAVVAGTWTAASNAVSRRQAGRWAAQAQAHQPRQPYRPPPPGRYQRPMYQPPPRASPQAPVYPPPPYPQQPAHGPPATPPAPEATTPAPAAADMSQKLALLQRLGELKAQGILTDAEFAAQKRRILGA